MNGDINTYAKRHFNAVLLSKHIDFINTNALNEDCPKCILGKKLTLLPPIKLYTKVSNLMLLTYKIIYATHLKILIEFLLSKA